MSGVDPELDNIKHTYDGMDNLLTEVATVLSNSVPDWAREHIRNCIFFPQLGFLTVVPINEDGVALYEGQGLAADSMWERMFSTEEMCYYKNKHMHQMDEYFGDMYGMICGRSNIPFEIASNRNR